MQLKNPVAEFRGAAASSPAAAPPPSTGRPVPRHLAPRHQYPHPPACALPSALPSALLRPSDLGRPLTTNLVTRRTDITTTGVLLCHSGAQRRPAPPRPALPPAQHVGKMSANVGKMSAKCRQNDSNTRHPTPAADKSPEVFDRQAPSDCKPCFALT